MVAIKPLFYAKIEVNGTCEEDIKLLNLNGIDTYLNEWRDTQHKLTRLICYLNPEGPKKLFEKRKYNNVFPLKLHNTTFKNTYAISRVNKLFIY